MHAAWQASMRYFEIPENEWQDFYDWYCKTHPDGDHAVSRAYEEWRKELSDAHIPEAQA